MAKRKNKNENIDYLEKNIEKPLENIQEDILPIENKIDQNVDQRQNSDNKIENVETIQNYEVSKVNYDEEVIEGRLEEAKEAETPKKKKKSRIVNTIFLIINICLMVFIVNGFLGSLGDGADLVTVLQKQGDRLWWLAIGLVLYIVFILGETCVFSSLIKGTTGKRRPYLSYRVATIGKYYDNITPFSVGGQPFQIVTLTKDGLSAGISTSLPIIKLIVYNIVYTIVILTFFIFGIPMVFEGFHDLGRFLMILLIAVAIIGLIITAISGFLFILIGNGKIVGRTLARWVVKVGYRLRIVKDYRKTYNKIMMQVREYQNSMDFLKRNKLVMVKCIIYTLIEIIAYFTIPVVCVLAFSEAQELTFTFWVVCMTKIFICQMAAVILPLPGGTGMMEIGFILVFGSVDVLGNSAAWGLLAWRILTYYVLILHGFIQTIADNIVSNCKSRRLEKLSKIDKSS